MHVCYVYVGRNAKTLLMVQSDVFPFQIALNLYFYAGTAFSCEGGHYEVKQAWIFDEFLHPHDNVLSLSIHVESLENLINIF